MYTARLMRCSSNLLRRLSTATKDITVEIDSFKKNSKIATVFIHRAPVNSLNIPFTVELTQTLKDIEASNSVDAVILKSAVPKMFSAGLDFKDLYRQPGEHVELLWKSLQDCWLQLYSSKLVTVACINGHCLAGGVILAAACDYRLGTNGDYKIGITASRIGLVMPPWVIMLLSQIIGKRKADYALQLSHAFTPGEAFDIGFFDALCPPNEESDTCSKVVQRYLSVSQQSRSIMKHHLRSKFISDFESTKKEDAACFVSSALTDSVQNNLSTFLSRSEKQEQQQQQNS